MMAHIIDASKTIHTPHQLVTYLYTYLLGGVVRCVVKFPFSITGSCAAGRKCGFRFSFREETTFEDHPKKKQRAMNALI